MNACNRPVRNVSALQAQKIIENTRDKPVIVRFFAHWCAACHESAPKVQDAANAACEKAEVIQVDGDSAFNSQWATEQGVKAFPSMVAYKNGRKVGEVEGALESSAYQKFFAKWQGKMNG